MTDNVRHHTSFRIAVTDTKPALPPRLPVQESGDYAWRARGWADDAHAFPPVELGRLPAPAVCGERWTAAFAWEGANSCTACVAGLRDRLRALSAALAAAGVDLDRAAAPLDPDRLAEAILDTQGSRDLPLARWEAQGIIERLADGSWAAGVCGICKHDRACHSSGGMCDGDGSVCYCSRFPDAPDLVFAKPEVGR